MKLRKQEGKKIQKLRVFVMGLFKIVLGFGGARILDLWSLNSHFGLFEIEMVVFNALSRGSRLILMNSVMSSMPLYFMSFYHLTKWVISAIDRIRRAFFWKGTSVGRECKILMVEFFLTPWH